VERVKELASRVGGAARDFASKSDDTVHDTGGEKMKLNIEIMRLESKARKLMARLRAEAYAAHVEQKLSNMSLSTPVIKDVLSKSWIRSKGK
jgi:hypothetical protein